MDFTYFERIAQNTTSVDIIPIQLRKSTKLGKSDYSQYKYTLCLSYI